MHAANELIATPNQLMGGLKQNNSAKALISISKNKLKFIHIVIELRDITPVGLRCNRNVARKIIVILRNCVI